jgi:tetratricopeptide (TPR) repeat protein
MFKHDLIRDVAYETLPRGERRRLHGRIGDWLEEVGRERLEELLSVLAHHAVHAGRDERALDYLTRAAERAGLAAAHREQAALLARAVEVAQRGGRRELISDLQAHRGRAFADAALWPEARVELERALADLAPARRESRARILRDLSMVCFWSLDTLGLRRYASEAVTVSQEVERNDLTASALAWLAEANKAEGDVPACLELYERAIALAGGVRTPEIGNGALVLYHVGRIDRAVEVAREAARLVRTSRNASELMWTLPHLGLALASRGEYAEAAQVFSEARRFGREHEVWPLLARAVSMSVGFHLDVFDLEGAEQVAGEARELASSVGFAPSGISAGIDLLLGHARRSNLADAERLLPEITRAVETTANWHGWLWKLRLAEAHAEVALARGDLDEAAALASDAIEQSQIRGRIKYQILGLGTRAQALLSAGRAKDSIADLRRAIALARSVGDPALILRSAALLLAVEGDDLLVAEARAAMERISEALPDDDMRARFEQADPVRVVARLIG